MTTFARRSDVSGPALVARRTRWELARLISAITAVVVGLIVVAILLVVLEANRDNAIVDWLIGAGEFLAKPFDNVFDPGGRKTEVAINWGLAAVVYAFVGGLIARLVR
jgi:hypothetical protein